MEMNFSQKGLDELIEKAVKRSTEDLKERRMRKFEEIISGISRKYSRDVNWIEFDDLYQDLWERTVKLIYDCGGVENTDESLVARVCFNCAVDKYRYHRRRYDSKAEYIEGSDIDDWDQMSKSARDYFDSLHSEKFAKGIDLVFFKEVIDLFEIGSRERKYVVMKLVNSGIIDKRYLEPWDQAIAEIPETEDEEGYIHALGYKSHSPGSWTCKKRELKRVIHEFLKDN